MADSRPRRTRVSIPKRKHSVYSRKRKHRSKHSQLISGDNFSTTSIRSPSNASVTSRELQGIEILEQSKVMWVERSKESIGVFKVVPFEYNIFDDTGHRILFVMPTIGSDNLGGGSDEKPSVFSVLTCMGREICDIKYSESLHVRVDEEPYGVIEEIEQNFIAKDSDNSPVMKISLSESIGGGFCSRVPKRCTWSIFLATNLTIAVGIIGRNGRKVDEVVYGQPLGFYYMNQDSGSEGSVESSHKLYFAALLVGLMVKCMLIIVAISATTLVVGNEGVVRKGVQPTSN